MIDPKALLSDVPGPITASLLEPLLLSFATGITDAVAEGLKSTIASMSEDEVRDALGYALITAAANILRADSASRALDAIGSVTS